MFSPRPDQQEILEYVRTGGRMGVSAVPGSGKTTTLSYLAAQLVRHRIHGDQEVVVVTYMNSAADTFSRRIREFLGEDGLLPGVGYRVRTLHGLGNDIVRERPALVGLSEDFSIIDERGAFQVLEGVVSDWIRDHPRAIESFLSGGLNDGQRARAEQKGWPAVVRESAQAFIRRAKDLRLSPAGVRFRLGDPAENPGLREMGADIYEDYQRALGHRGVVDFDDLIGLAVDALRADPGLLNRLRRQWPYVLEDEAQDSSELQEQILRLLTEGGNWVRVGDPNQAVNTTFTTSDTRFLLRFMEEPGTQRRELFYSGRSALRIIRAANGLVDWAATSHPHPLVRVRAFTPQHILPVPGGRGEWPRNPEDPPGPGVLFHQKSYSPGEELRAVVGSISRWLPEHQDRTVAVLVPDNRRGAKVVEALRREGIESDELLRNSATVRLTADRLARVLNYLAEPLESTRLAHLYEAYLQEDEADAPSEGARPPERGQVLRGIRRCRSVEDLLWPSGETREVGAAAGNDTPGGPTHDPNAPTGEEETLGRPAAFLETVRRWLEASVLPVDQLVLTVAQDLFGKGAPGTVSRHLAVAHKIGALLRAAVSRNPGWRLGELAEEVGRIAANEGHFIRFEEEEAGFSPTPGRVTVSTLHRAKGLEWDRVYLLGVNTYDFPSAGPGDVYRGEEWFVRDGLNLVAESAGQLEVLGPGGGDPPLEGDASRENRLRYVEERLRLLYVGITRARRELIVTTNYGRNEQNPRSPALALEALRDLMNVRAPEPPEPSPAADPPAGTPEETLPFPPEMSP